MLPVESVVHSGTRWTGGRPDMEENPALRELRTRTRVMQQMERTDPTLHALVSLVVDTACEATPVVVERKVPESDAALHAKVAEDVRLMFGWEGRPSKLKAQTWEQVCRHLMLAPSYGFSLAPWFTYAGEGGAPWVERFALPDLASVWRWVRDDRGRLVGWEQYAESGQARADHAVPLDETVLVTHRGHGDDPEGTAILRACWPHWKLKRQAIESTGQTTDRAGVPPVVVDVDPEAMRAAGYTDDEINEAREKAEVQAARFNRKDGARLTNLPGITFRFMDTMFDPSALLAVEARCDEAFAFAFSAGYTRLGLSVSGAENVGEVQREAFLRFVASRMDDLLDALTVQCIAPVIRRRHGERGVALLPIVTHKGLRPHPLARLQAFVPGALTSGAMRGSEAMQDAFNELAGLPAEAGRDSLEGEAMAEAIRAKASTPEARSAVQVAGPGRGHVGEGAAVDDLTEMGEDTDPEAWVPAKDAAARFGASAASLKTLHGKGAIRCITLNGRRKYLISDIERALGLRDSEGAE